MRSVDAFTIQIQRLLEIVQTHICMYLSVLVEEKVQSHIWAQTCTRTIHSPELGIIN